MFLNKTVSAHGLKKLSCNFKQHHGEVQNFKTRTVSFTKVIKRFSCVNHICVNYTHLSIELYINAIRRILIVSSCALDRK